MQDEPLPTAAVSFADPVSFFWALAYLSGVSMRQEGSDTTVKHCACAKEEPAWVS